VKVKYDTTALKSNVLAWCWWRVLVVFVLFWFVFLVIARAGEDGEEVFEFKRPIVR